MYLLIKLGVLGLQLSHYAWSCCPCALVIKIVLKLGIGMRPKKENFLFPVIQTSQVFTQPTPNQNKRCLKHTLLNKKIIRPSPMAKPTDLPTHFFFLALTVKPTVLS